MSTDINNLTNADTKSNEGFFYIIQTSDVPNGVYKIGKTTQIDPNKRLCRYPQYSTVKYTVFCNNADLFEDIAMRKFKSIFKRRMEFGLEYYEGDIYKIIDETHKLWMKYNNINILQLNKEIEKIKPNGWQYFANEWLSKNNDTDVETAYISYVDIMTNIFASNEYAEKELFVAYFNALNI
jgi:hypothetical protein